MSVTEELGESSGFGRLGQQLGLYGGPLVALAILLAPIPNGLTPQAWSVVALGALMIIWWVTEAIPIAATALLPLIVLPFSGATTIGAASAPYADRIVFLFIGGFILAAGVERWRLHERIALSIASRAGDRPILLVAGFMIASAAISMWISNTATTLMLMPIAMGAARALAPDKPDLALGGALALGVAHAATIGGIGTPVGTPTNLIGLAFLERAGEPIAFFDWMVRAIPMMLVMLPLAWMLLCLPLFKRGRDRSGAIVKVVRDAYAALGKITGPEIRVACVFAMTAMLWMFGGPLSDLPGLDGLHETSIGIAGALSLFLIPSGRAKGEKLIDWPTAERIPWGIAIMFGGGLSLAAAMDSTGLAGWIGAQIAAMSTLSLIALIAVLVIVTILVSEVASNVATLTSMLPIVAAVAAATNTPLVSMAFPVAIAASFAFMLPVATAPNAIAYSTGLIKLPRMLFVGLCLNIAAATMIIGSAALFR